MKIRKGILIFFALMFTLFCIVSWKVENCGASTPEPVRSVPVKQSQEKVKKSYDSWNLLLVNNKNSIPNNFKVNLTQLSNGQQVDERIYEDLQAMMDDARSAGLQPSICSAYRNKDFQTKLYNREIQDYINKGYSKKDAVKEASSWVAVPGSSEHETGLALDIVSANYMILDEHQEETPEQKWLMENSYKYGFILRYPSDKSEITGIQYEPWHYRYVGKEAAKEIKERGICLEEYINGQ